MSFDDSFRIKPALGARINPYHYLSRDIEGLYLFNEGSGNICHDITGNGHDILICLNNTAPTLRERTFLQWSGNGNFGRGSLRGKPSSNSMISGSGNILLPYFRSRTIAGSDGFPFSFEAWVNIDPALETSGAIISGADGANSGFYVNAISTGWQFDWRDFTHTAHTTGGLLGLSQWYHIAASVYNQSAYLYVNGLPYLTLTFAATTQPASFSLFSNDQGGASNNFVGLIDMMALYKRPLSSQEIWQRYSEPFSIVRPRARPPIRTAAQATTIAISPAQMKWQAQTVTAGTASTTITITPARMQWYAQRLTRTAGAQAVALTPAAVTIYANDLAPLKLQSVNLAPGTVTIYANTLPSPGRVLKIQPAKMKWQANKNRAIILPVNRDCGAAYDAALSQNFIAGDWLVQAPAIGLKQSFHFDTFDGTWGHNIVDISDIETSVPPGGGLASVNNVTVRLAENNVNNAATYRTIANLWESQSRLESVACTIDFLLDGQTTSLRVFTGHIDTISVQDAITSLLLVDDSISKNLMIPQMLITSKDFPNADSRVLTQPEPIIYGRGSKIGAAPLLLIDTTNNTYMVAGHPMQLGGQLAVFNQPTATFLTLPNVIPVSNNNISGTITLGTVDTATMSMREQGIGNTSAENCVDGVSNSIALIGTAVTDSNLVDGVGYVGVTPGNQAGYPITGTIQLALTNHRRSTQSDPTTNGTFTVRTIDPTSGGVLRNLFTAGPFNHVTSLQNNVYQISNVAIGINELIECVCTARSIGTIGNASQTYEIGEISITPITVFSANASGTLTAVRVPTTIQELRFNRQSPTLTVAYQNQVTNASAAVDGISTTLAYIGTGATDSNLDGIGELMVAASVGTTSAQRANNIIVVNFTNQRRSPGSDPTVTGTFTVRTLSENGQILRDNLFTAGPFRQSLNPLTVSYTAPAINLGTNEQLAIRLVARNEGNPGSAVDQFEVGDIDFQTYYQPPGDSSDVALLGLNSAEYLGRTDPDGTVTSYAGLGIGTLLETPDEVVASILSQEVGLPLDAAAFAAAYNFFAAEEFVFDGGIGADWSVTRQQARELLNDLARWATAIIAPTFAAQWGMRPYRTDAAPRHSFDISNILCQAGADGQSPEQWQSTFVLTLGNLQTVYNHFEVHYKYNIGSKKYDKVYSIDPETGSTLPSDSPEDDIVNAKCLRSFARYGKLAPLIYEAHWIADDLTAKKLIRHLVNYFVEQRIFIEFDTTFVAACLQVGDFITVSYPSLPNADNGQSYEIHSIRYIPVSGRIHIIASRPTTPNTTIAIEPAKIVYKAITALAIPMVTVSPARMEWKAANDVVATLAYSEGWDYNISTTDDPTFAEGWSG